MNNIELLSPAGDFDGVKAAVLNGANAVYLGVKQFSARQNAANFDFDQLAQVVSYCHTRAVKVYLALNTLVFDQQIAEVISTIKSACSVAVDAIIVQDLGIMSLIKKICPTMPIHASTQMAVHTKMGAQLLLDSGASRVVLARELTLAEIEEITRNVQIEVEVFVHGALCMSVSGQCYVSGMIGTRSGNRGNCAGTCRLPFATPTSKSGYALSLKDNCLVKHIEELKQIGVTSIKIEGRMKRPEYVASATDVYKKAINNEPYDLDTLRAVFARDGFTDAYLTDNISHDMYGFRGKNDVISATAKVFKALENTYKKEVPLVELNMSIKAVADSEVILTATDLDGNTAIACAQAPHPALTTPMTNESLSRSLAKLGSTPFFLGTLDATIGDGLMLPASVINELRRTVCDDILAKRAVLNPIPTVEYKLEGKRFSHDCSTSRVRFRFFEQLPTVLDQFEYIILPIDEVSKNRLALTPLKDKIIIEPDRVMFKNEERIATKLHSLFEEGYRHLLCDNMAHIMLGKADGYTLHGGAFLNCMNSHAIHALEEYGIVDATLSFEGELSKQNCIKSNIPLGIISYGYLPLMIMKSCPIKANLPEGKTCKECKSNYSVTDRMEINFRIICNNYRYCELLNSSKLYMADRSHEMRFPFTTLYFTVETKEECENIIEAYANNEPTTDQFTRGLYYRTI